MEQVVLQGQAIWLAIVQGLTEFLPVSSSGHLALLPRLFNWQDQGLAFDVAVHVGTLLAVVVYFADDLQHMLIDWLLSWRGRHSTYSKMAWMLIWATIPVGLAGLLFEDLVEIWLRHPLPIALATIFFALWLGAADYFGAKSRNINSLNWLDVAIIGCAQILALIPGTSRSGITMTAGLALGLQRDAAARFSFLLAIPVITLAGGWEATKLIQQAEPVNWSLLLTATLVSALTAWLCIHTFLKFVRRFGMMPFVIYRILLGIVLLWVFVG